MASSRRPIARSSALISRMSSWVAGRRSSMAPATALRLPLTNSSTVSRVRSAEPTVACTVRSTASRTASGSSLGLARRRGIGAGSVPQLSWRPMPLEHALRAVHLEPSAHLAERVLLPGDPRRALLVAQSLLDRPTMFNHSRGLWGYTGAAPDGEPLTVQSTGMGGPSAAIVCEELISLGARRLVRIGTCGALVEELAHGDLIAAKTVLPADGASRALGADGAFAADPELTGALVAAGAAGGTGGLRPGGDGRPLHRWHGARRRGGARADRRAARRRGLRGAQESLT